MTRPIAPIGMTIASVGWALRAFSEAPPAVNLDKPWGSSKSASLAFAFERIPVWRSCFHRDISGMAYRGADRNTRRLTSTHILPP